MFTWTAELDPFLLPARGEGTPLTTTLVADKKLFAVAREAVTSGIVPRASVAALIERGTGEGSPADEADLFLIVGGRKAGRKLVDGIVDRWFARLGARGAAEVVSRLGEWLPDSQFPVSMLANPVMPRIRAHLAHAADYETARDFLATHPTRDAFPAWSASRYRASREMVAFLLPDHRELVADAIAYLIEANYTSTYLLPSIRTPAELAQLAGEIGHVSWEAHAVTLAHALRDDALPALIEYSQSTQMVPGVARALTAYVSVEAADALALYVDKKPSFAILQAYFTTHRELARQVLEPLTSSKKKAIREAAAKLLP